MYKDSWMPGFGDGLDGRIAIENCLDWYDVVVIVGWSGTVKAGCFLGRPTESFPA